MNLTQQATLSALRTLDVVSTENSARQIWIAARKTMQISEREVEQALAALVRKSIIVRTVKLSASSKTNFPRRVAYFSLIG